MHISKKSLKFNFQELHAHLNGSLSNNALIDLLKLSKTENKLVQVPDFYRIIEGKSLSLSEYVINK